jgi:P4 family phage/plasmid primase-like protien
MALDGFLKSVMTKSGDQHTHTKIGDKELQIHGGSYCIPPDKIDDFYRIYKKYVFIDGKQSYLTEKQQEEGPILIDVDFRYTPDINCKQHTIEHICKLIDCILQGIKKIKMVNDSKVLECYVFEKDNVNMLEDKTKDGIHLLINLKMDYKCKLLLRKHLLSEMPEHWKDLPIQNSWSDVFDESVIKGYSNWQLYGSRKPGNEQYGLRQRFICTYKGVWNIKETIFTNEWILNNFEKLTARNKESIVLPLNPEIEDEYNAVSFTKKTTTNIKLKENSIFNTKMPFDIKTKEELDEYISDFMEKYSSSSDNILREAHQYVMALPEEFWGPGSYPKRMRVGWALRNTDSRLFVTWIKFSIQHVDFDFSQIPDLYDQWNNFGFNKEGLSIRSIIYWCKTYNKPEYIRIYEQSVSRYILYASETTKEYDLAMVLYQLYKDRFVCSSHKDKEWYEFKNNKWDKIDDGHNLRALISTEVYRRFKELVQNGIQNSSSKHPGDEFDKEKKSINMPSQTAELLKKTAVKSNIMKEAQEIFYDSNFLENLDTNPFLLCCNNYVIDFKEKEHRKGRHDDYLSKSTNIDYQPLSHYKENKQSIIDEINEFMSQIYPNESVKNYMWEHLASTLIGNNPNQSFYMYVGCGSNGKSCLIDFMTKVLGDYKGTVPISLITQKRVSIGNTSSEVYQLKGTRYAVMQEPSKGDAINEGIMKEITGGDPIQCRALYKESVTFIPQFKLVVCTNNLFEVKSQDDGTWRRIQQIEHISVFVQKPFEDEKYPAQDYPNQFAKDKTLNQKFESWAPVMLSMLVDIAYRTQGIVNPCSTIDDATQKYRQSQDIYLEFINSNIMVHDMPQPKKLKITTINDAFKNWHSSNHGTNGSKLPPLKELKEYLNKKYGVYPKDGWSKLSLIEQEEE